MAAAGTQRAGRPQSAPPRRDARVRRAGRGASVVPERFMRPRLILYVIAAILVGFGLLMVYSASSVTALADMGDAAYYLKRQLGFAAVGLVLALLLARSDYHLWSRRLLRPIWFATILILLLVFTPFAGQDALGANRWINIGGFGLQPSEFAKIMIVLTAANLAEGYFEEGSLTWREFVKLLVVGVGVPLALIIVQPDKGSTMVLGITIVVMGYLAGLPKRYLVGFLVAGLLAFFALALKDDYSRQRFLTMLNPWADPYGTGYQLIQGFYAFASGGLLGVGIGFSKQKYSYLPMAHNDFIFAVIGEECGLVGALGLLAGFALFLWAGLEIARHAPDLAGRLIAAGCSSLVIVQLLLNVAGVLGIFPLSGKPIPFVSYGGSSIIASLMLVGLIASVSRHSRLPETTHDSARRSWRVSEAAGAPAAYDAPSLVGEPRRRSERATADRRSSRPRGFSVVAGGARPRGSAPGGPRVRSATGEGPRRRIDLGPGAAERLRNGGSGPRTR